MRFFCPANNDQGCGVSQQHSLSQVVTSILRNAVMKESIASSTLHNYYQHLRYANTQSRGSPGAHWPNTWALFVTQLPKSFLHDCFLFTSSYISVTISQLQCLISLHLTHQKTSQLLLQKTENTNITISQSYHVIIPTLPFSTLLLHNLPQPSECASTLSTTGAAAASPINRRLLVGKNVHQ